MGKQSPFWMSRRLGDSGNDEVLKILHRLAKLGVLRDGGGKIQCNGAGGLRGTLGRR